MPIIAETPKGKDFKIPSEGTVQAVLSTVKDLGLVDTVYNGEAKKTRKVQFIWQIDEKDEDGGRLLVFERFTLSLHEKSMLYKRLKGLLGKNPPLSFDLETLVGTNTNLVLVHNQGTDKNGQVKTYANIAATIKLRADQVKMDIGQETDEDASFDQEG